MAKFPDTVGSWRVLGVGKLRNSYISLKLGETWGGLSRSGSQRNGSSTQRLRPQSLVEQMGFRP